MDKPKPPKPYEPPPILTCPKCGAMGVVFICATRGCPVNSGAAHPPR